MAAAPWLGEGPNQAPRPPGAPRTGPDTVVMPWLVGSYHRRRSGHHQSRAPPPSGPLPCLRRGLGLLPHVCSDLE